MAVGNIVRRVLGLIREVAEAELEEDHDDTPAMSEADAPLPSHDSSRRPGVKSSISTFSPLKHGAAQPVNLSGRELQDQDMAILDASNRPPLLTSHASFAQPGAPVVHSLFGLFNGSAAAGTPSPSGTPTTMSGAASPATRALSQANIAKLSLNDSPSKLTSKDVKADVIDGIGEILDELEQVATLIADHALEHIHGDEIVLVHGSSSTVQKFLVTAARKRKFTVVHVESCPNDNADTYSTVFKGRKAGKAAGVDGADEDAIEDPNIKPLTAAGITVIVIPEAAVFAVMSRVNKVILSTHSVLANGGLVASVGSLNIAQAAKAHMTPVVVLSGVYKLSPLYPFDLDELIEYGDASKVVPYEEGDFVAKVDVTNPLTDYVPEGLVDLYITNAGGYAPSYLYRIVADHYNDEDLNL